MLPQPLQPLLLLTICLCQDGIKVQDSGLRLNLADDLDVLAARSRQDLMEDGGTEAAGAVDEVHERWRGRRVVALLLQLRCYRCCC
jgi:hypothetical protein